MDEKCEFGCGRNRMASGRACETCAQAAAARELDGLNIEPAIRPVVLPLTIAELEVESPPGNPPSE